MHIDDAVLDPWSRDQLTDAEALLSEQIANSEDPNHHLYANRALVRARLRQCHEAIEDAKKVSLGCCCASIGLFSL